MIFKIVDFKSWRKKGVKSVSIVYTFIDIFYIYEKMGLNKHFRRKDIFNLRLRRNRILRTLMTQRKTTSFLRDWFDEKCLLGKLNKDMFPAFSFCEETKAWKFKSR